MVGSVIDNYMQANILLSRPEVTELEIQGELTTDIYQTWDKKEVPLKLYYIMNIPDTTDKLPIDQEVLEKGGYIIYINKEGIEKIKKREVAGAGPLDFPKYLRKIYMSLEDVF